jgi:small subunit ribosomal protein S1
MSSDTPNAPSVAATTNPQAKSAVPTGGKGIERKADLSAELSAEIDAAMNDMIASGAAEANAKAAQGGRPSAIRGPRVVNAGREHRTGKVVSVGPSDVFIELGPKELGIIARTQYATEAELPKPGDEVQIVISKFETSDNVYICSRPGAVQKADWEMLEAGQVVEARVVAVANGKEGKPVGLELEVANHRAFMPASAIGFERVENLGVFVGEKMKCKVTRVERVGKGNIVLSRRDILAEERKVNAEALKGTLQENQTVEGTVRKVMPFGAFVDIGGVDGLIHISDITHDRIGFGEKAVAKYLKEGQKVTVRILKLDWENDRISLGLKQTQSDPFATAVNAIVEGAEVSGRVTKILEFGAFVEIGPGVEGLVHISEIDYKRINKVEDALKVDEIVMAKVLKIDRDNRRVSLSIKALKPAPEPTGGDGKPGRGGKKEIAGRSAEEIQKVTPALRREREKFHNFKFKGGLS